MDPSKLEREVLILRRCNSAAVALNRALTPPLMPRRQAARGVPAMPDHAAQGASAAASHAP